ncbi:hypothetical protein quinque_009181 [Culex quinquefasciatus]
MLAKPGHLRAASAKVSRFDETVGVFSTAERKCGEEEDLWSRSGHDRDRVQLSVSAQFPNCREPREHVVHATQQNFTVLLFESTVGPTARSTVPACIASNPADWTPWPRKGPFRSSWNSCWQTRRPASGQC